MQVLERYFEAMRAHDWEGLAACLADDVRRTGPYLDVVEGKAAYVEFLAGVVPSLPNHRIEITRVRQLEAGSVLVELSETLDVRGESRTFPEAIFFDFDPTGRIQCIDIYIKQPPAESARPGGQPPRPGHAVVRAPTDSAMPMPLTLERILVFAPDLEAAGRFYGDVLGLELESRAEGSLSFRGTNFELTVFRCEHPSQPDGYSQRAGSSLAFAVPSLEAAMSELSAKGVQLLHTTPNDGPVGRYVAFVDPFGTVHELVEPRDG